MKARSQKCRAVTIPHTGWLRYAAAGGATAVAGATSADAEIHYSGPIQAMFGPRR